jgi:formamidopyrimidine-DNA glycosylase
MRGMMAAAVPELPEVERFARFLAARVLGREIVYVHVAEPRFLRGQDPEEYRRALTGRRIASVLRYGKHLLLELSGGYAAWIHFGMDGRVVVAPTREPPPPHTRVCLHLDHDEILHLVSARMLGGSVAGPKAEVERRAGLDRIGPDALLIERGEELRAALGRGRRPIKVALMDQAALAGLGNIQAAEALFRAGLSPERPAASLDDDEWERLRRGIAATLADTIESFGGPEAPYVNGGGDAPNPFLVYGRAGEPCPACRTPIEKTTQGGRSTFFCPRCQPPG